MKDTLGAICVRHREEWARFRNGLLNSVLDSGDLEQIKVCKGLAEVLKICQEAERRTFVDDGAAEAGDYVVSWE